MPHPSGTGLDEVTRSRFLQTKYVSDHNRFSSQAELAYIIDADLPEPVQALSFGYGVVAALSIASRIGAITRLIMMFPKFSRWRDAVRSDDAHYTALTGGCTSLARVRALHA